MTNDEFILQHRLEDVGKLALKRVPEGIDMPWCLQQIEGWQTARRKLPRWADAEGALWFPPRLSMEQCSSQHTALYKCRLAERLIGVEERGWMMDLTGGFGIDFSYMAGIFGKATYVERQEELCRIARHNLPLLGLLHAEVVNADCSTILGESASPDLLFIDPARRDDVGRKTVAIEDCTPNVVEMQDALLARTRYLIIKLSPMLDITQALRALKNVVEVHVVSVRGECKELLLVLRGAKGLHADASETNAGFALASDEAQSGLSVEALSGLNDEAQSCLVYHCVNLDTEESELICTELESMASPKVLQDAVLPHQFLFEPNASVLKAGCQDQLCNRYAVEKIHACSNLFIGDVPIPGFPGRQFCIEGVSGFGKKELKGLLQGVTQANLTIRNFPASVAELRKKLKLKEGGDTYLFATTRVDGSHIMLRCIRRTS